jgi:hypothetical protein
MAHPSHLQHHLQGAKEKLSQQHAKLVEDLKPEYMDK